MTSWSARCGRLVVVAVGLERHRKLDPIGVKTSRFLFRAPPTSWPETGFKGPIRGLSSNLPDQAGELGQQRIARGCWLSMGLKYREALPIVLADLCVTSLERWRLRQGVPGFAELIE